MANCWSLKCVKGPEKGKIFPVSQVGGSYAGAAVQLELFFEPVLDVYFVKAHSGAERIKVNGKPIQPRQPLKDGDRIAFDQTELVFEAPDILDLPDDEPETNENSADSMEAHERKRLVEDLVVAKQAASQSMNIELTSEALNVPDAPATAKSPAYSPAMGKMHYTSSNLPKIIKVAMLALCVGGGGFWIVKKNALDVSAFSGLVTANQRQPEAAPVAAAEPQKAAEQAPPAAAAVPAAATAQPVAAEAPGEVSEGVEATLLSKCAGDSDFCFRSGEAYFGDGNFIQAIKFYTRSCEGAHGGACFRLGELAAAGKGLQKSETEAARFYVRACELKVGLACAETGKAYTAGVGIEPSVEKAAEAYLAGCTLDNAESCYQVGLAYREGKGLQRAPASATDFMKKACRLSHPGACDTLKDSIRLDYSR